ncbi:YiiX/YebB-like N1pC/P60 family cysteine hydrolase [Roseinatronobacter sp.]|uniref:YiiX/YebB-like N1pC/P60 family cysteine hydrolase n=1 Tax=Roseinatronobacter sp. TaxID=1945755 RepID=UPI0025F9DDD6|nr:YiiX/YebB-like N1pC/P60 family cysteine hydrolase [Roseibaca sp.]
MSESISIRDRIGQALGRWLERDRPQFEPRAALDPDTLVRTLRRGDVLLVEGRAKISTAIKYLTQSTWSHAALYVGDMLPGQGPHMLVEATLQDGVHAVPLSRYARANIRICRAVGLSEAESEAVARYMIDRIGYEYDLRNIIDLARYLFPTPPVPVRFRRRMLALGSGDPTRAICSSLVAQAFQSVRYPILPDIRRSRAHGSDYSRREIFHIRHHSLFVPRDFDLSPYFEIVKPSIRNGFDHGLIEWAVQSEAKNLG